MTSGADQSLLLMNVCTSLVSCCGGYFRNSTPEVNSWNFLTLSVFEAIHLSEEDYCEVSGFCEDSGVLRKEREILRMAVVLFIFL